MQTNLTSQSSKRRRVIFLLMPFSALLLLTLFISSPSKFKNTPPTLPLSSQNNPLQLHIHSHRRLQTTTAVLHCEGALYHDLCVSTLTRVVPDLTSSSLSEIISATVNVFHDRNVTNGTSVTSGMNETTTYDLVVAKDGSGNFTTIGEALNAAPNSSATRFVIYIKAGAYYEYVDVTNKKKNLMFVGDGIGKTLIKGNRNVIDGWTTFRSATLIAVGANFIMKGITVENYAGPSKHQAVALRSGSDFSIFYQCSFIGYQDTLYVHSLRQFYRECDIYGTVDFVFGNAAVVFQKSNFYARQPEPNQKNMFTAQGRDDPNQNTGISILECKIAAGSELIPNQSMFKSYLGRPWKKYSKTVIMRSYIGDLIDPAGWLEWSGDFALSTLYYGEYMNRGPGSNTSARVTWPGYRVITNETEASQFTVTNFIQGGEWLNGTGVPYYLDLQQNLTVSS
ncbi:putative pectinesterase [Helianthus annuus]|nr:putative pectinesterase [Helianthus annuus]